MVCRTWTNPGDCQLGSQMIRVSLRTESRSHFVARITGVIVLVASIVTCIISSATPVTRQRYSRRNAYISGNNGSSDTPTASHSLRTASRE